MFKKNILKKSLSSTTKKTIGKKTNPIEIEKKQETSKATAPLNKVQQENFQIPEQVHFKAKVTAMEMGKSLKEYLTDLIIDDLSKRGKM